MQIIANPEAYKEKEQLYFDVRNKEGRIISDALLKQLPYVDNNNPYKAEWDTRAANFKRFLAYLMKKFPNKEISVLDVGCGNGWMTNKLYEAGYKLTGVDLNMAELQQAEKVFGSSERLIWVYADVLRDKLPEEVYDIILLSASCQYFDDMELLTKQLSTRLSQNGEIHLTDSIFYKDAVAAKKRSFDYYSNLGYTAMVGYYHHHSIKELQTTGYKKLYPGLFTKSVLQWWYFVKK